MKKCPNCKSNYLKELTECPNCYINEDYLLVPKGYKFIKFMFTLVVLLQSLGIIFLVILGDMSGTNVDFLSIVATAVITFGLYKVTKWVVPFILFVSYVALFHNILRYFTTPDLIGMQKILIIISTAFLAYVVVVFSKKETKSFFKAGGKVLISH